MKTRNERMRIGALALAVQGALAAMYAMPAHAENEEMAALKNPTNFVQFGVSDTSHSSAKFGEYSGLNKSGTDLIGNFSVRGGDAYGDGNGTRRWSVTGSDLGLTSRALGATIGNQGRWNVGIGYDELRQNITDSYQTPYQGSMGGNSFVLPAGFGVVSNATPGTRALNPTTQLPAFHTVDVGSTRKNTSLSTAVNLTPQWDIKLDYNRLDQSGAKLMGFGSAAVLVAGAGITGEAVSILPNPTNYKTDTLNLALNWIGEKGHATASYFGSFFRDGYDRVTFQTYAATGASTASAVQTMTTPPNSDLHQFNLSGGYQLAATTKLTGGLSYGRNTQNAPFVVDPGVMITPLTQSSLNGLVVTTHADLKLTDQTTKDLALSAGIKYDKNDDRSSSNIYNFNSLANTATTAAHYPNTPLSHKKTQFEVAGDYRLGKNQQFRLALNRDDVKRWCNQYAAGVAPFTVNVNAYVAGVNNYPAGTNCIVATATKEDKLSANYKVKASDALGLNLGYAYGRRTTDSDQDAIAAFISTNGNANPSLAAATLVRGINGGDYRGFYPLFDASRKQQVAKAGANWQASEKLSVGMGGRYTDDKYDSTYGVQKGNSASLNLDATFNYTDTGSVSAYLTRQQRQRDMTSLQRSPFLLAAAATNTAVGIPSGATWTNTLKDNDTTFGLSVKQGGLLGGRLEMAGDLTYSLARTAYATQLNYATTTLAAGGSLTCAAAPILSCGDLPAIRNSMRQFKLTGTYQVDKTSQVAVAYVYRRLSSDDYFYNGYQSGFTPNTLMPTNQQSGSYSASLVAATYTYSFR
jgi:MtrB/PioB family decaheme-associated outer membrane protein